MKAKEEDEEKMFKLKSYGKSELASLYLPDIAPRSAADVLKKWIDKSPGLPQALAATGLQLLDRRYTPAQVRFIIQALGEP